MKTLISMMILAFTLTVNAQAVNFNDNPCEIREVNALSDGLNATYLDE